MVKQHPGTAVRYVADGSLEPVAGRTGVFAPRTDGAVLELFSIGQGLQAGLRAPSAPPRPFSYETKVR